MRALLRETVPDLLHSFGWVVALLWTSRWKIWNSETLPFCSLRTPSSRTPKSHSSLDMRRCSQTRFPHIISLSPSSSFLPWFLSFFFKRGSHEAKCPLTCHVAKDNNEFLILPPSFAKCWAYRPAPPQLVYQTQGSSMLGKHWSAVPAPKCTRSLHTEMLTHTGVCHHPAS